MSIARASYGGEHEQFSRGEGGAVGAHIANQASLDPRNHAYRKLSDLVKATGLFNIERQDLVVHIRDARRA